MRACVLTATGGIEHLQITDVPDAPAPRAGEVRVAMRAAALNHLDLFVVEGMPGGAKQLPHIVGADGAGVVEAVGQDVATVRPGDRVMFNPGISDYTCEFCRAGEHSLCVNYRLLGEHLPGTVAELVTVPAHNVARIPLLSPELTWAEAGAFSLVTLTAWRMLVTRAQLKSGETALIWGIGGGVSLAALRIAKLLGARVIVTSSNDAKLAAAKQLGADVTFNHRTQKVSQEVRALTNKRGVDVVVENVGAATWDESLRCLRRGGRLVICGATSGPQVGLDLRRLFWHHWSLLGSTMGNAAEYAEIVRRLGKGELRPVVDRVYPMTEARKAFEHLAKGEQLGKVVVEISSQLPFVT
jgi:NADPH:quinone reductase-like Zn-dependent oxidoreductase